MCAWNPSATKVKLFFYRYMYFLMGAGLQILILHPDTWDSEVMRVKGRGESPEDMYRVGGVNDGRRWV